MWWRGPVHFAPTLESEKWSGVTSGEIWPRPPPAPPARHLSGWMKCLNWWAVEPRAEQEVAFWRPVVFLKCDHVICAAEWVNVEHSLMASFTFLSPASCLFSPANDVWINAECHLPVVEFGHLKTLCGRFLHYMLSACPQSQNKPAGTDRLTCIICCSRLFNLYGYLFIFSSSGPDEMTCLVALRSLSGHHLESTYDKLAFQTTSRNQ